jgi:hypothetical protein
VPYERAPSPAAQTGEAGSAWAVESHYGVSGVAHVGLHGNGHSAGSFDRRNYHDSPVFAPSVVHDDCRTFRAERFGDPCADATGCPWDYRDELNREAFERLWLNDHAKVVMEQSEARRLVKRYVQLHSIGPETEGQPYFHPATSRINGVTIMALPR